jgi:hypothetical protein
MYNFVNCLQFNIRCGKIEHPAPMGGALVKIVIVNSSTNIIKMNNNFSPKESLSSEGQQFQQFQQNK